MTATLEHPSPAAETSSPPQPRIGGSGYVSVSIDRISVGASLRYPLYDRKGVLLVKSGMQLTQQILDKLHSRDISFILIHRDDLSELLESSKQHSPAARFGNAPGTNVPVKQRAFEPERIQKVSTAVAESVLQTRDMQYALARASVVHLDQPRELADESYARLQDDQDLALRISLFPTTPSYPAGQGSTSATLAMSMAMAMGFNERSIREVGVGCLLHDAGMLKLGRKLVLSKETFTPEEKQQVNRHVAATAELISNIRHVPQECRLVATQIHERFNGRGYPARVSGARFHPLARVAAVADCYTAMVSPRLYRPPHTPYRAVELLLRDTQAGQFDPACVRALLQVVSLVPLGSFVELNDGRVARVVRSNAGDYTRPVVEILTSPEATDSQELLDLQLNPELGIARILDRKVAPLGVHPGSGQHCSA